MCQIYIFLVERRVDYNVDWMLGLTEGDRKTVNGNGRKGKGSLTESDFELARLVICAV